jgi:hypothetical protein
MGWKTHDINIGFAKGEGKIADFRFEAPTFRFSPLK